MNPVRDPESHRLINDAMLESQDMLFNLLTFVRALTR